MLSPGSGARRYNAVLFLLLFSLLPASARTHNNDWADAQYENAGKLRDTLEARPQEQRSRIQYQRVIEAYRRIYFGAPASGKADPSAAAVADLTAEMGRRFKDQKVLRSAIKQYEFLRREYPGSKARFQALLSIGQIYKDDLNDPERATAAFQEFVHRYPHNSLTNDVRKALTAIAQNANSPDSKSTKDASTSKKGITTEEAKDKDTLALKDTPTSDSVDDQSGGDAEQSNDSNSGIEAKNIAPTRITAIRYAATPNGERITINLGRDVKYNAQRLSNPDRIFFNLYGAKLASSQIGKDVKANGNLLKAFRASDFKPGEARVVLEVAEDVTFQSAFSGNPHRLIIDLRKSGGPVEAEAETVKKTPDAAKVADKDSDDLNASVKKAELVANDSDDSAPAISSRPSVSSDRRSVRKKQLAVVDAPVVREAQPTADGDRSLIRALGLKIGKIVIDPGHGGHDTGTIGPHGLLEKDLVLDVSKRLGKLLQTRLGADVVYTRSDDTFIPLEERTAIANQEQADLFISVHANSSHDPDARGVETYYLNFTSSPDALEVAARENAGSDQSIHQLQDLVKTIALKEKIEESREFASDVETALHSGLSAKNPAIRDRGVKKAPFIVLIGANMPSILAEISFVSNPSDERKLGTPAYRQKIAESLYHGISKYVNGLSGIRVASTVERDASR
jgi:N-acetylmuramoyl-L-alanine amidase